MVFFLLVLVCFWDMDLFFCIYMLFNFLNLTSIDFERKLFYFY